MEGIFNVANGSSSSLYGCISYDIQNMIISKFPEGYFKYTGISTELAARNIRRTFGGQNSGVEIAKRKKPYIYIQPTYLTYDRDDPFQNIPLTRNFDDLQYRVDKRYLFEVVKDRKYGYNLKFKMNRDKIEFDTTVITSTLHQQLDIYKTLQNQIVWERPMAHNMALESVIPKPLMALMSKIAKMDLEQSDENIPIFTRRLNSVSAYPIIYKMRNASATDEWFMYYTHQTIVTFTDLSLETGSKKNMADDAYPVTFKVTVEFNMPGVYFVDGRYDAVIGIDLQIHSKEYSSDNDVFIPVCTLANFYNEYPTEKDGKTLYCTARFNCENDPIKEERIQFGTLLDRDHREAINISDSTGLNRSQLINIFILKDSVKMTPDADYYIDWSKLELVIKSPDKFSTYRMIIYYDFNLVNSLLENTKYRMVSNDDRKMTPSVIPNDPGINEPEDPEDKSIVDILENAPVTEESPNDEETDETAQDEESQDPDLDDTDSESTDNTEDESDSDKSTTKFSSGVPEEPDNPYKDIAEKDLEDKSAAEIHNLPLINTNAENPKKKRFSSSAK